MLSPKFEGHTHKLIINIVCKIDYNVPMCMYVRRGCFYCDAKNLMSVIKQILKDTQPTFISKQKQTMNIIIRNKIMSHILNRIFN